MFLVWSLQTDHSVVDVCLHYNLHVWCDCYTSRYRVLTQDVQEAKVVSKDLRTIGVVDGHTEGGHLCVDMYLHVLFTICQDQISVVHFWDCNSIFHGQINIKGRCPLQVYEICSQVGRFKNIVKRRCLWYSAHILHHRHPLVVGEGSNSMAVADGVVSHFLTHQLVSQSVAKVSIHLAFYLPDKRSSILLSKADCQNLFFLCSTEVNVEFTVTKSFKIEVDWE